MRPVIKTAGGEYVTYPAGWRTLVNRGLGQVGGDFVSALASAIQQVEGYYPPGSVVGGVSYPNGSLAYRNNNPGNLRLGSLAVGATGQSRGYAVFPDFQTGWNALLGLIQSPMYWNLTLTQFFAQYAPSADNNNPAAYAATVAANLGVDANTPISQLASGGSAVTAAAPTSTPGSGGVCDPTDPSYDPTQCAAAPADTSDVSSLSDVLGGISPLALGVLAAAFVGVALVV